MRDASNTRGVAPSFEEPYRRASGPRGLDIHRPEAQRTLANS
jgi:hypothetical protein